MSARREAFRSVLLQATFLSSSVFLVGAMPPYARAQVVCSGTTAGGCTVGPDGLVSATAIGVNGSNSDDTDDQGSPGATGGVVTLTNPAPGGPPAFLASVNGGNGGRGYDADWTESASRGGDGGNGGGITITNEGAITTSASAGYNAISAWAIGGSGGTGGAANATNGAQPGGTGGDGGTITISNSGAIVVSGPNTSGILAFALGGVGGLGGASAFAHDEGPSGTGGNGGAAVVTNRAAITTEAADSIGIYVATTGGAGVPGAGVHNSGADGSYAGNGGGAGGAAALASGAVPFGQRLAPNQAQAVVQNYATITTNGQYSSGIWIWAVGGAGGDVGYGSTAPGGNGGNGGTAYVGNSASIQVSGDGANGIGVTASGGAGGQGGYHTDPNGGAGGTGGKGGAITIVAQDNQSISTNGTSAIGILADASGGAGGAAGFGDGKSAAGGSGGNAGSAFVFETGDITTTGAQSAAVSALAVGGTAAATAFEVTSPGGSGGIGGTVYANVSGNTTTTGASSSAIYLDASGGGGGDGSSGGHGGHGGSATLNSSGTIKVSGDNSNGIAVLVQGGAGGYAEYGTVSMGAGGGGGNGGTATVTNTAGIAASGLQATGILINTSGGTVGQEYNQIPLVSGGSAGAINLTSFGSIAMTNSVQSAGISIIATGGNGCIVGSQYCGPSNGGDGAAAIASIYGSVTTLGQSGSPAISLTTAGGSAGTGYITSPSGAVMALGGAGGAITVTVGKSPSLAGPQIISTVGTQSPAIALNANGGSGGNGESTAGGLLIDSGGPGGSAGDVTLTIPSDQTQITTQNDQSPGISATAIGGDGGSGNDAIDSPIASSGSGGVGGAAGIIDITSAATITTSGQSAPGIIAVSAGGNGGYGGIGTSTYGGAGGSGAVGPAGGYTITVTNSGTIATYGDESSAIVITSTGGNGGSTQGDGATAGVGGAGGNVEVLNSGVMLTTGENSHGILATTIGGGGGTSNKTVADGIFVVAQGGAGGDGAAAGNTSISNSNVITTTGSSSNGVFAFSTGGGGGDGGSVSSLAFGAGYVPAVSIDIGGKGGSGAAGGTVSIINDNGADITTAGPDSAAIRALSVGGAGGFGGQSNASVFTAGAGEELPSLDVTISVAGSGGTGGAGGIVSLTNLGSIITFGDQSPGLQAETIGGGGGDGGNALTHDYTLGTGSSVSIDVTMGGAGGTGGDGGAITLNNNGTNIPASITTLGFASDAAQLISIGGGGGNGGTGKSQVKTLLPGHEALDYVPLALGESFSFTATLGGNGGSGGNGGDIGDNNTAINNYALTTYGSDARGIYALSVGGGGGTAAAGTGRSTQSMALTLALGGNGGAGGDGGAITLSNQSNGTITTLADGSHGIFAQSIGGGGGSAGTATADIGESEGGSAAEAASQYVLEKALSEIPTLVENNLVSDVSPTVSVSMTFGGQGGAGGNGGNVQITNQGTITTGASGGGGGDFATGIFGQSVGGGGGSGGSAIASGARLVNAVSQMGGSGGAFGVGGNVTISSSGAITTDGNISMGVLAQSIGGGGGAAGAAPDKGQITFGQSFRLGGAIADRSTEDGTSGGGTVSVTTSSVTTAGNEAHGVVGQSIGGGGGLHYINQANAADVLSDAASSQLAAAINALQPGLLEQLEATFGILRAQSSGNIDLVLGGTQESSTQGQGDGSGGEVTITNEGSITTSGVNAIGVLAQSIGGGGGFFADGLGVDVVAMTASGTLGNSSSGSVNQAGGAVYVDLVPNSRITTTGNGATAVVAQSIGGGGGYTGAIDALGVTYQAFLSPPSKYQMTVGANTEGGDVSITSNGTSTIQTSGANAHGIIAQSLSGGGGLVADGSGIIIPTGGSGTSRGAATSSSEFSPGAVSIDFTGTLSTTGAGSVAIFAQSGTQNSAGAIDRSLSMVTSGDIDVSIGGNSEVTGGSGVYAITLDGGGVNQITIGDGATLSSVSYLAVSSGWGTNTLTNYGQITGDIVMPGMSSFDNAAGATYISALNGTVSLGGTGAGGGTLMNEGIVDVAGVGTIGTLDVVGTYAQSVAGAYRADVDGTGAGSADLISATDVGAAVSGTVIASVVNSIVPNQSFLILEQTGDTPITSMTAATAGLEVTSSQKSGIGANWAFNTTQDQLTISTDLTFAPDELPLGDNERAYADHLQNTWDAGGSERLGRVYAELFNLPSPTAYQQALSSATPVVLAAGSLAQAFVARDRLSAVQSCPEFDDQSGAGTLLVQRDCAWGRVGGGRVDFTPGNATGYTINQMAYAAGFQTEVAPDWFAGMSASYMTDTYSNESGLSTSDGQGVDVTAVLKREMGQWLFSGALNLGYGWYDAQRWTLAGSKYYQSDSSYDVFTAATRLRADYEVPFQNWYLKPFGQLDLLYASTPGYEEGGHGSLYDLSVEGSDNFSVAIGPHLEVGGRINLEGGSVVRPYASAGVTWFSNSAWQVSASLLGAPEAAGTFRTTVDAPDLLADLTLGLQWSLPRGIDFRVNYEANLGDSFTAQSGMARLSVNF